jgi:hypothetical protein
MLQTARSQRIGHKNPLKFVKDDELPIELSNMVEKGIP